MLDYCAKSETLPSAEEVCEKGMPTSEILKGIRKELAETIAILTNIRLSLEGKETPERKYEEPKCLYDEVKEIEHMSLDCMGLSHSILDRLFGIR